MDVLPHSKSNVCKKFFLAKLFLLWIAEGVFGYIDSQSL